MATTPFPLAFNLESRDATLTKDAKLVNAYAEKSTTTNTVRVIKRPGYGSGTLYEAGVGQGLVNYLGVVRVIVNNKFFKSPSVSVALDANDELVDFA